MDHKGEKKCSPAFQEYAKAKWRWIILTRARKLVPKNRTVWRTWKELTNKYPWIKTKIKMTRRQFYFWKNIARHHFAERINSYENTRWYVLRTNKKNITIKPWFAFLDRTTSPVKKEYPGVVKSSLKFIPYSKSYFWFYKKFFPHPRHY